MAEESGSPRAGRRKRATVEGEFADGVGVQTALIAGETFGVKAVQYTVVDGQCIVEGDISLGTVEQVAQQNELLAARLRGETPEAVVISGSQFRWPQCRVAYTIDAGLANQQRVTDAIAHWEATTSYRFTVRTNVNASQWPDWITFQTGSGCSSAVGKRGGQQFINLATGCTTGNVIHEIGHAIGLWHEQSREDRDAFVTIRWDKIQSGKEHNFNQHISDGDDVGAYDYGSIMHYPRNAFSVDGSDTITPVDPNAQIGQRTALSAGDIAAVNSLCSPPVVTTFKEPIKDFKEPIKDFREPIPTGKELVEPIPTGKEFREPPIQPGPFVQPGPFGTGITPIPIPRPGVLPFAVAMPHQAQMGDPGGELQAAAVELQQQLAEIEQAMAMGQQSQAELEQHYAQVAAMLQQAVDALGGMG